MPVELFLSPLMRPILIAKSLIFIPHRSSSPYIPLIKDLEDSVNISTYVVLKRFGSGSKIFDVFDTHNGKEPLGSDNPEDCLFYFVRSRAVKGAYKLYPRDPPNEDEPNEPFAVLRAGVKSNVALIRSMSAPIAELGWHNIDHKVDAIDSYKMFSLADGFKYQWTKSGQWLEKVSNLGERESEVRERIAKVSMNGSNGFTIQLDNSKIPLELALSTALCSYLDQWNTNLGMGGIFYPRQKTKLSWRR